MSRTRPTEQVAGRPSWDRSSLIALAVSFVLGIAFAIVVVQNVAKADAAAPSPGCSVDVAEDMGQLRLDCGDRGAVTVKPNTGLPGQNTDEVFKTDHTYGRAVIDPEATNGAKSGRLTDAIKSVTVMPDGEMRIFHTLGGPNCMTIVDSDGHVATDKCGEIRPDSVVELWDVHPNN